MVHAAFDRATSPMTLDKALTAMLREKRLARRSEETISTYQRSIGHFLDFYGDRPLDAIDDEVVQEYAASILERGVTDETYAHYLRELKLFLRWMAARRYIPAAPRVILPTLHPKERQHLVTEDDFGRLVRALGGRTLWNLRDVALVSLLYDSGARISELLTLPADDVNLVGNEASVLGKGKKRRTIFFGDATAERIHLYRRRLEQLANPEPLFVTRTLGPLNRDAAGAILDRAKVKSGVTCDVNPHNFRHTFATRFLRNGGNPLYLRRLLGHTTLAMTENYVNLQTADIKEAHEEYNERRTRRRESSFAGRRRY